ncbi:MAG: TdeIII family type II restriction endonuclease [Gammaproteobacteria bacterium]
MPLTAKEKTFVKAAIAKSLREKFKNYSPDGKTVMPFHTRLLGKDRMALFSFIQSLNTTFGTAIYEPVAATLATTNRSFQSVECAKKSGGYISAGAEAAINQITRGLQSAERVPNLSAETEEIRRVCRRGEAIKVNLRRADVYIIGRDGCHYPVEIKTAKPNIDGFEKYKDNLLKWTATVLYANPQAKVAATLAIPYNPDHPQPYKHWTMRGVLEKGVQIKVADAFWDFLAGKPVFDSLLDCFEETGIEMRGEIDEYFKRFRI